MSILYIESLDTVRQKTLQKLSHFADDFVLAGGTAIMLIINHRLSYDFDCFSIKPIDKKLLRQARQVFGNDLRVQIDSSDMLLFRTAQEIKIDFVYFPYPPLYKNIKASPISLFNLRDLAANKAYTVGRRPVWRDYVDMFFLIQEFGLEIIISDAKKKFKGEFNEKLLLEQLVYFTDIEVLPTKFVSKSYTPGEIKEYLQKEVKTYTRDQLK